MGSGKFGKGRGLFNCWCLTLFFIFSLINVASAADYPTKPIQIIVPFGAGGPTDVSARLIGSKLSALLGQPVVVINKTGASGVIGLMAVLAAPPDGYTILFSPTQLISAPLIRKGLTYDFVRDFTWVNMPVSAPTVFAVKKDAPWVTLRELIADAKKNPGKLTYGSPGIGSTSYFICEALKAETGVDMTHIPFESETDSTNALLGGHISFSVPQISPAGTFLKAGSVRGLAMVGEKRHKEFPDIPTVAEQGLPNIIFVGASLIGVRSITPPVIVERLEKAFQEALKDKEIVEKSEKIWWVVENLDLKETREFITKEYQRRLAVAKALNLIPK